MMIEACIYIYLVNVINIQILPFKCQHMPAVQICHVGNSQGIIVMQDANYCLINIYKDYLEWNVARIIWIAFYKNEKNKQCLIGILPKDIVICILNMLGRQSAHGENTTNQTVPCIKI